MSLRKCQDYIPHSIFLFSPPTFFWVLSVLHICHECQMTAGCPAVVARGAEGFGAGGTGYSAEHFAAGGTGAEDAGDSVVGVGVHFGAAFPVCFVISIPVLLSVFSSFLQMGQCSPHVQFFAACLGVTITLGIAAT